MSTTGYSRIERGMLGSVPVGKLRRVAAVLEVRLQLEPRWRGAAVDRLLSSRHAAMTEAVSRILLDAGWEIRPEASFSWYGERGVVDILGWHGATRTLLIVELKTELVDPNDLLAVTDRRRRLAAQIAAPFGWVPRQVAEWVVVAESRTNRRRLAASRTAIRAVLPSDGHAVARWLRQPTGPLSALSFLPDNTTTTDSRRLAPRLRVRTRGPIVKGGDVHD